MDLQLAAFKLHDVAGEGGPVGGHGERRAVVPAHPAEAARERHGRGLEGLGGELTILIIAHRLTTLKGCDQIVSLDKKNNAIQILRYEDIVSYESKKQGG